MFFFMLITHTARWVVVALGIFSFSHNLFATLFGTLVIAGSSNASPWFALLAYPAVEFFFNGHQLTVYSAITASLAIAQIVAVVLEAKSDTQRLKAETVEQF